MVIDWRLVIDAAVPIAAVFITVWAQRRFERRSILVTYFGHVAAFQASAPDGQRIFVNTHAVVVRNTGRRSATNVRLRHHSLPDFVIWPHVQHHVGDLSSGGREIVIPTLVPDEEITISYLYFAPTTVAQINAGVRSDEGFARQIPVLLQRQYPRWLQRLVTALVFIGLIAVVYLLAHLVLSLL